MHPGPSKETPPITVLRIILDYRLHRSVSIAALRVEPRAFRSSAQSGAKAGGPRARIISYPPNDSCAEDEQSGVRVTQPYGDREGV
jgi:hypothetical protein